MICLLFLSESGSNLIDFNTELPPSASNSRFGTMTHGLPPSTNHTLPRSEPEYVNGNVPNPGGQRHSSNRDPFDMSKYIPFS